MIRRAIVDDAIRASQQTVTVREIHEISREWLTRSGVYDTDDVYDVGRKGDVRLCISHGNASKILSLPVNEHAHPDCEIPVTAPIGYSPMNAPCEVKTIKHLINDVHSFRRRHNGGDGQ